jgi:hypothetical protein
MNFIVIILNKKSPVYFTSSEVDEVFFYEDKSFEKLKKWVGLFYSFFTYKNEKGIYFLANINYSFASKGINSLILNSFNEKNYIDFFEGKGEDPISIINIQLKSNAEKNIKEEGDFSQWFGNDYLYKCEVSNEYCFVFELPKEINVLSNISCPW